MGKHLVPVGGGHGHLFALKRLSDYVRRGHRVTVIGPASHHYYSGMGPGMISGLYRPREARFNIRRLVEDSGGLFIEERVVAVCAAERTLRLASGATVTYDVASFNVGSEVPVSALAPGRPTSVVPVKPVGNLLAVRRWFLERGPAQAVRVLVVGGGPAGVEVPGNVLRLGRLGASRWTLPSWPGRACSPPSPTRPDDSPSGRCAGRAHGSSRGRGWRRVAPHSA